MLRVISFFCFYLICCSPCFAQDADFTIPISYTESDTESSLSPQPGSENFKLALQKPARLNLFELNYPAPLEDYWAVYANKPRVTYSYRYHGIRGLLQKNIRRGLGNIYDKALKNSYEFSYLDGYERDRVFRQLDLEAGDAESRFWEQRINFWDYLPVDKGGHSVKRLDIGTHNNVISIGPISLSNEGKLSWSGWDLSVTPERELNRDSRGPEFQRQRRKFRNRQGYNIGISPPRGNIYTGDSFTISGSMKVSLRINDLSNNNRSSITGKLEMICFTDYRKTPWLNVQIRGRARPLRGDYGIAVVFSLLTW